jgi:hypothetical protein
VKNKYSLLVLVLIFTGCCGSRGPRSKAGFVPHVNLVEILYKNMDESIFFAGPLSFSDIEKKDKIQIDFTASVLKKTCDSVKCNFTLFTENPSVSKDSVSLKTADTTITKNHLEVLFTNIDKKTFQHRFSFYLPYSDYIKILDSPSLNIMFNKKTFVAPRRWKKNASEMKTKLGWLISGYL